MINKDKSTTSFMYGLRLVASRTYLVDTQQYKQISRSTANNINSGESLQQSLFDFFNNGSKIRYDAIHFFIQKLSILYSWMKEQQVYRYYSSSILFVYDGGSDELVADMRMIDFAHVFEIKDEGYDTGYVKGLKNLIKFFNQFQETKD